MASLNTLRTKYGAVLSIIIALALLFFIVSMKDQMFSPNDPKVGEMDGEKISYTEYYAEYERIKNRNNVQESDEQQSQMLANAVWQSLFAKHVLEPGFEQIGLTVGESERQNMINGRIPTQTLYSIFADPATGEYNVAALSEFLLQAEHDPQAQQMWIELKEQLRSEREAQKFYGLIRGGAYVNKLEIAAGVDGANKSFSGQWTGKHYASVPDSLFTVSNDEIKSYYNAHKSSFRQVPNRTVNYVIFEVAPTEADLEALERKVMEIGSEFAATEELRSFVRSDSHGTIDDRYLSAAQLQSDEAEALLAGKTYGPVLKNNQWTMARAIDSKMAPDSLGLRHIVLSYNDRALADSLKRIANSSNFGELAAQYSLYTATAANGGDLGVMPFASFTGEIAEQLAGAKVGEVIELAAGDAIQLIQVYKAGKPQQHVMIASISYPLEASDATRTDIHNQANTFLSKARGSQENFQTAASEAAVTPRVATLSEGERLLSGMEDSREVVRWAFGAEKGDLSDKIFTVGKDYLVAFVSEVDDELYAPVNKVATQIRAQLLRDKKYDYILAELSGATIEEQAKSLGAEVGDFADVTMGSYIIDGVGFEPRVVGAITATASGQLSAPVKGSTGLFVVRVDDVQTAEKQTPEGEQVRVLAMLESMLQQLAIPAIQQMAQIRDLRGEYF